MAELADTVTTQHLYAHCLGHEANPLAKPFVDAGWGGQIAELGIMSTLELLIRYGIHRLGYHRIERLLPVGFALESGVSAYHNALQY
jgi:hypothetical protein